MGERMGTTTIPRYVLARNARFSTQRGVTILIALVAMLILLFSSMALIRSFQSTAQLSGNLAFKRDLVNQGERAMRLAWDMLNSGALSSDTARQTSSTSRNYSAVKLASTTNGIPYALLSDSAFSSVGSTSLDLSGDSSGTKIRYVIDRLCVTGTATESASACSMAYKVSKVTGTSDFVPGLDGSVGAGTVQRSVYRVSVRVSSVRGTVVYMQTALWM